MNRELVDLYNDYLLSSPVQAGGRLFGATTATGLSDLPEGSFSHDPITRFLSQQRFDSKTLWQLVKPMVRAIEDDAAVLVFDDTIEDKPYTDEDEFSLRSLGLGQRRKYTLKQSREAPPFFGCVG